MNEPEIRVAFVAAKCKQGSNVQTEQDIFAIGLMPAVPRKDDLVNLTLDDLIVEGRMFKVVEIRWIVDCRSERMNKPKCLVFVEEWP